MQTILDVKKTFEDKALTEFSEQQKEFEHEKETLKKIKEQKIKLINSFRELKGQSTNIYEIILRSSNIKQCQKNEALQKERVQSAGVKVDQKREALLEATQKRKMMEILKSKAFEKFKANEIRLERTAIDEMAIVRHNRRERT
ncbi:MAG: flagellar export protein FliJ [Deltaproteobacteria bacterium]|nr:flagellar export protein FliJ [Deltaproteobacteria bacterium]